MDIRTVYNNGTCDSLIDMHLFLHYSLIPSVLIIILLSFLERRSHSTKLDDKIQLLHRRFGFVIPLDLIGTFHNRWTFGFAFGAIANKVMSLFSNEYLPPGIPTWARALGLLVGAIEVGMSYYPIFACLTTDNKIIGSVIGFLYTLTWISVTITDITTCPHGNAMGYYEKVIFQWPSLLCLVFLMGRFVYIFIKYMRIYMGADIRSDEKCFLPIHQAEHVRRLFRKAALSLVFHYFPSKCSYGILYISHIGLLQAAIARYSGWQVAHILWGYLIMHIVQCLFGLIIVYGFVYPIKHGQGLELLKGLGISILTLGIGISLSMLQVLLASNFFLQKKIAPGDKNKPLALNNRKGFHNFNYFFFFYNVILGLGACLIRLFISLTLGSWLIARIDRTLLQHGYESADTGYKTWIGMIYVDHYHTNPVLVSFCNILLTLRAEKRLQDSPVFHGYNNSRGPRTSVKSRTRWLLYYTLLNNPRLIIQRKQKEMDDLDNRNMVMQSRLIQASVLEVDIRNIQDRPVDINSVDIW
ncbi:stimulated by retinoic acid gene 6 protein-like isoform X4 [Hyla sarda]|uniref:stimulated by retinoic acid gene 6 protein-like isoform X4 n=1 Tax=Hyla sarda TaxID=327740 RepID=UPI0024C37EC1|nr:stimulated by retinoic acid gene 6 protein-like isoform X4 [Hyla sarda]